MPLACRDFIPAVVKGGFFASTYEPLDAVVARANDWMRTSGARVINVETVVLPNLDAAVGADANAIRTSGEMASHWFQVVRVWYEVESPPPLPGSI